MSLAQAYAPFERRASKSVAKVNYARLVKQDQSPHWGLKYKPMAQRNRALRHARQQAVDIHVSQSQPGKAMMELLERILLDTSAYPTLSLDEDGVAYAEWRAGKSYIAIEIEDQGTSFVYSDLSGNIRVNLFSKAFLDSLVAKNALAQFTADLDELNPNWRNYF